MRTIATRLLPNPHCLSSHAVHRIRHGPAVRSSRWHGCARAGLRSAPAPLPTGAARLLLQRMVDPRHRRPFPRPRATPPVGDAPNGLSRTARTAFRQSPNRSALLGFEQFPSPPRSRHDGCVAEDTCGPANPSSTKQKNPVPELHAGEYTAPRTAVSSNSRSAAHETDAWSVSRHGRSRRLRARSRRASTSDYAKRPRRRAGSPSLACRPCKAANTPRPAKHPPANTQRNGPRETKTGLMVCRSPGTSRVVGYTR